MKPYSSICGDFGIHSGVNKTPGKFGLVFVRDVLRLPELITREMLNGYSEQRVSGTAGYLMHVALGAMESNDLEKY